MTSEEMERATQLLLESQAQLSATVGKLSEKVDRTAESVTALLAIAEIHEREIVALTEASRATGDKLNALISTVERFVTGGGQN